MTGKQPSEQPTLSAMAQDIHAIKLEMATWGRVQTALADSVSANTQMLAAILEAVKPKSGSDDDALSKLLWRLVQASEDHTESLKRIEVSLRQAAR